MSDIGLPNLDALLHGAILGALAGPVALLLAWRLARGLPRLRRLVLAILGGAGGIACVAGAWSLLLERESYADEAMTGALLAGLVLLPLGAALLFFFTPRA